jgi:hypothetical protein
MPMSEVATRRAPPQGENFSQRDESGVNISADINGWKVQPRGVQGGDSKEPPAMSTVPSLTSIAP